MGSRSRIALGMIVKNFRRLAKHPWIGTKLATLQGEKWLFNLLYPRAHTGEARKIRQLSFRITDLCNLRCHTCGQWGDQGFLHGQNLRDLKRNEVSLDRYLEILRDLTRHGHHPFVYLWGGEPMLYEGSLKLIEAATRLRLPSAIATNGGYPSILAFVALFLTPVAWIEYAAYSTAMAESIWLFRRLMQRLGLRELRNTAIFISICAVLLVVGAIVETALISLG